MNPVEALIFSGFFFPAMITPHFIYNRSTDMNYFIYTSHLFLSCTHPPPPPDTRTLKKTFKTWEVGPNEIPCGLLRCHCWECCHEVFYRATRTLTIPWYKLVVRSFWSVLWVDHKQHVRETCAKVCSICVVMTR